MIFDKDISIDIKDYSDKKILTEPNKKIALSGAFCTGKSSIANKLNDLGYPVIFETARRILENLNMNVMDIDQKDLPSFQESIVTNQIKDEEKLSDNGFITDTSLVDNLAYSYDLDNYEKLKAKVIASGLDYDKIFYFPILGTIEDDGLRHVDYKFQKTIDNRIKKIYKELGIEFIPIQYFGDTVDEQINSKIEFILKHIK